MSTCCDCLCHVNPRDYVPCCPRHGLPLVAAEAGHGTCLWVGKQKKVSRDVDGREVKQYERCTTFGPGVWVWSRRDKFNGDEIPPHNGYTPPTYDRVGGPHWHVGLEQRCSECGGYTPHAIGESRAVCLTCGAMTWHPAPAHQEA